MSVIGKSSRDRKIGGCPGLEEERMGEWLLIGTGFLLGVMFWN